MDKSSTSTPAPKIPDTELSNLKSDIIYTKDEELRLMCLKTAALAMSGTQFAQPASAVINAAKEMERYIKRGE